MAAGSVCRAMRHSHPREYRAGGDWWGHRGSDKRMLYSLARPLLFALDAERAHRWTLAGLDFAKSIRVTRLFCGRAVHAPLKVMGLQFPNAVGLAAGLDKNAEHIDALSQLGFGHIEVGTVTPRAQPGNPPDRKSVV